MKKVILLIAVISALTFDSCAPKSASSTSTVKDSVTTVDSVHVDSLSVDTTVAK